MLICTYYSELSIRYLFQQTLSHQLVGDQAIRRQFAAQPAQIALRRDGAMATPIIGSAPAAAAAR
jgi:hypothetical protein